MTKTNQNKPKKKVNKVKTTFAVVLICLVGLMALIVVNRVGYPQFYINRDNLSWYPTVALVGQLLLALGALGCISVVYYKEFITKKIRRFTWKLRFEQVFLILIGIGALILIPIQINKLLAPQDLIEVKTICRVYISDSARAPDTYHMVTIESPVLDISREAYEHFRYDFGSVSSNRSCKQIKESLYYLSPLNVLIWP